MSEERKEHKKLVTVGGLEKTMRNTDFSTTTPPDRTIVIDNTNLSPDEVTKKIIAEFRLDEKSKELKSEHDTPSNQIKLH